ncbi:hypothetical protein K7I13_07415 [Brucepastera parasyntrophica]|uniref:hypothetical protein n=1 Tax=Brucepastera parasyntrophica TaxID=2880008 RepID=UPI00210919BF|nr:hypothetical protein [Brucepastera parasyntrophica]ULQ61072.1 hypothetical protein K7I13_07415 [Brucepastera parasyntrophica]
MNLALEGTLPFQNAAILNYAENAGFQLSGLLSIAGTAPVQFSGILNYSGATEKTVQLAGLVNISRNQTRGAQLAGLVNFAHGGTLPFQAGVILNYAENAGFQLGGILNIVGNTSVQIGTVLNIAKNVSGLQLGLINIAENNEGVAIGLINIVKNGGKREFEIAGSETVNTELSFRLGTNRFYSVFIVGAIFLDLSFDFTYGAGFGTHIGIADTWSTQVEVRTYSFLDSSISMLHQLRITVEKSFLSSKLKVFAGPVLNVAVSDDKNSDGEYEFRFTPYSIWSGGNSHVGVNIWVGAVAGLRF